MTVIGFHASHEQLPPAELLRAVQRAEEAGFGAAMCSDHLAPWSVRQGESGHAWSWLGAALQATRLPIGVVTAPGQRYHPAVAAQAIATLESMFPGRFWAALGSGEALNEHVTADPFPPKPERDERLAQAVAAIRRLLAGEEVSTDGLVRMDRARIWSLPAVPPPLHAAAVSHETAREAASWADGLITVDQPRDVLRALLEAYRAAGGRGPVAVQVHLSWAPHEDEARAIAHEQWRTGLLPGPLVWELATPEDFDRRTADATVDEVARTIPVSADLGRHAHHLAELAELGFDRIFVHHVGTEQDRFIDAFGARVLPALGGPAATGDGR
ncbi:TIGR03885 family FMN-dependent LLM class oxidoreductase [Agromyces soli]